MNRLSSAEWASAGSFTWTVPAGVNHVWVTMVGGGGGGSRDQNASVTGGHGGGSGEQVSRMPLRVTPTASIAVVVGAAGAKGFYANHTVPSGGSIATVGGNSSFGPYIALGGGINPHVIAAGVAGYGGGPKGGLQGNPTFPVFSDLYGFPESSCWFGGSGGGARADPNISPNLPGMNGGPSGGRLFGGTGGATAGPGSPPPGPGGGGGATVYGVGGNGGDDLTDGHAATIAGTGGGGAGGTTAALGVGPFHDGADGFPGYVAVFYIDPN